MTAEIHHLRKRVETAENEVPASTFLCACSPTQTHTRTGGRVCKQAHPASIVRVDSYCSQRGLQ